MGVKYYKIPKWREFQHYKDRSPPWIKLHFDLLTSETWLHLDDASRVLAIACMLIASRDDGRIPSKPTYMQRVAYLSAPADFAPLLECGFLVEYYHNASENEESASKTEESASTTLASCKQLQADASPEQSRAYKSTEVNLSQAKACESVPAENPPDEPADNPIEEPKGCPPCPSKELIALYHESLPELPRVVVENSKRLAMIRQRWRDFYAAGDFKTTQEGLECFRWYFGKVKESKFLTGRINGKDRPFLADLEWLVRPTNFAKVVEGRYSE